MKGRRRAVEEPRLPAVLEALLLCGPLFQRGCDFPTLSQTSAEDRAQVRAAWNAGRPRLGELWRQHEGQLRRLATERGVLPRWGGRGDRFFAECFALQLEERRAREARHSA